MGLFRRSSKTPVPVESLEQQVTRLQATLSSCKNIAQRRENRLTVAVAAIVLLLGYVVADNLGAAKQTVTEWLPALGFGQSPPSADAANEAYESGDYERALHLARPLAEQGDARAQSLLGLIHYYGRKVPRDDSEAMKWFRGAADKGDAIAQLQIGLMYSEGRSVPQDYAQAAHWYQRAADQGNAEAQHNLGVLYSTGSGVPQDDVLAHMWFNLAAAHFNASVPRDRAVRNRESVARKMSPQEVAKAQELARAWNPK